MKMLYKQGMQAMFRAGLAFGLMVGPVMADIIIDGQSIPGADIQSISVNPSNGNISVATNAPGYTVSKNSSAGLVAITSFTANPSTIVAGGTTTLAWTTQNAVSCTASGGVGGWAGSSITVPSGSKVITVASAGTPTFTLTCNGAGSDVRSSNVIVTATSASAVSITGFSASPATINEGDFTTLSWTTVNAVSCTASNGGGGWAGSTITVPSGNKQITLTTEGDYTFTLTCQGTGSGNTAIMNTAVTVNPAGTACSAGSLSGTIVAWTDVFSVAFPGPSYENQFVTVPRLGYHALAFNSGSVADDGKISSVETTQTIGVRLGSISQCRGDFDVPSECKKVWGIGGGIRWATNGRSGACQLEPNKTYYFNITYTDGVNPASTTCTQSPCVNNLQHSNQ